MVKSGKILVVDDNVSVLNSLELFLKHKFEKVKTLKNPNQIPSVLQEDNYDIVILDMNFTAGISNGNEGLYWLKRILDKDSAIVIIMFTAYGEVELAVNAMKEGATDFIVKPWDNQKLLATLQAAMKLRQSQNKVEKLENKQKLLQDEINRKHQFFIGKSKVMQNLMKTISKVAKTDAGVLILGENGTGKEVIAREIHLQSKRKNEIFVPVDLGSISETLFESEMFGYIKGAFTDAKENRIGRFEYASGGSLFLDEIGNLTLPLQSKLLTAIEKRAITPLGTNKEIQVDIRLISATNRDLKNMVDTNLFREDLLFRINTVQIEVPPLRDRDEDVILLANFFIEQFAKKYEKDMLKIDISAQEKLLNYSWPGNVRELKHTIERTVILTDTSTITSKNIVFDDRNTNQKSKISGTNLEEAEKIIIINALEKNRHNISDTAKELNITRQTLYRKMQKYGL